MRTAHLKRGDQYPNAKIVYTVLSGVYEYSVCACLFDGRGASHIGTVHLYNGPNAYLIITPEQKARMNSLKYKILTDDHKDLFNGLSRVANKESVGSKQI